MDFEVAAKNALKDVYPTVNWKGCFFQFTVCWDKNFGECTGCALPRK